MTLMILTQVNIRSMTPVSCFKIFFLLILWLVFCSFCEENEEAFRLRQRAAQAAYDIYKHYVYEIETDFAKQMSKELDLHLSGTTHQMHETVELIGMDFTVRRRASIPEARALFLTVIDKFVANINAHEKIQPFLEVQPFTFGQVKISINFEGEPGRWSDGSIIRVMNISEKASDPDNYNKLVYYTSDAFTTDIIRLMDEPREVALKEAQAFPIKNIRVHEGNQKEEFIDATLAQFRNDMDNKYGLDCWRMGGNMVDKIEDIRAHFKISSSANLEEARQLVIEVARDFLEAINNDPKLIPHIKNYPLTIGQVKLFIGFRKRRYGSHSDSLIGNVTLNNGEIFYYPNLCREENENVTKEIFPNEDDSLKKCAKEIYTEALAMAEKKPQSMRKFSPSPISDAFYNFYMKVKYFFVYLYALFMYVFDP